MQTRWQGYYLDGQTAVRQCVEVLVTSYGLHLTTEQGTTLRWLYDEIQQTQGFYAGEQIRLERGTGTHAEVLLLTDTTFLETLHQVAPQLVRHLHRPARRKTRGWLTVLAGVATIVVAAGLYLWGIPAFIAFAVSHLPVTWEETLGAAAINHVAPAEQRCTDTVRQQKIDRITKTLLAPLPSTPYTFHVIVVNDPEINALAAPGGYIVIFHGLLKHTKTAEEFAGVLAHELQHILRRHTTQALLRDASTGLLLTALSGDLTGLTLYGLEVARMLGMLRYSRRTEEEADLQGQQMIIAAKLDPAGLIGFFETLKKTEAEHAAALRYLSSHPSTADRIEKLRQAAGTQRGPFHPLLPRYDWQDMMKICQDTTEPNT